MEPVLVAVVLFGVIFGGILRLGLSQRKKTRERLTQLAARQRLALEEKKEPLGGRSFAVAGVRDGRRVRFWSYVTGGSKSQQHWVVVGVEPRQSGGLTFNLQGQGWGTKLAEFFGAKEIQVGDPAFDEKWFVRTNRPETFGAALLPEIRAKLTALRDGGARGVFRMEDGFVAYVQQGFLMNEKTLALLERVLPVLFDLADVVEVLASEPKSGTTR